MNILIHVLLESSHWNFPFLKAMVSSIAVAEIRAIKLHLSVPSSLPHFFFPSPHPFHHSITPLSHFLSGTFYILTLFKALKQCFLVSVTIHMLMENLSLRIVFVLQFSDLFLRWSWRSRKVCHSPKPLPFSLSWADHSIRNFSSAFEMNSKWVGCYLQHTFKTLGTV